ncbi:sensor histidine kinase [Paenibacillus paeoniae]|uniref:histidine kinase n=1 Tax=Paenibacillus paeoniae TaxID=2292705 RepID=A0A371PJV0_9BACL|nr:HAMP domain-containing sensor histidine kinase [Paenibacillus paeoniae]REK76215.1 ATP-binding protein [Paenibacillus paeoniae]
MLFVFFALWTVASIVWLSDPGSAVNRRLGALAFSGGAGALAALLDLSWVPYAIEQGAGQGIQRLLYRLQAFSSVFSYYFVPYYFLLFAISYRGLALKRVYARTLPWLLLIPIVLCTLFTPGYNTYHPITFNIVVWWAVPYIAAGACLVLSKRVPPTAIARTHWLVCFAVLPPVLFAMVLNYIMPSVGMLRMWVYNTWIVGLGTIVFVLGLFTYGFMGIRILIDRKRYDSTLRAVTSGTAMLNHAIKNDAGKLRLFGEKMKRYAIQTSQEELLADVEAVLSASRHMEEMVGRVHRRTEDLQLRPERGDLAEVVEDALRALEPSLGAIQLHVSMARGWICTIDRAQTAEAVTNIAMNAIEAMNGQGVLTVTLTETKRELILELTDTGPGMDRKLRMSAFDPFYTTKRTGHNFGLGLPYTLHVMRKHKGTLQMRSKKGEGTSFYFSFPKKALQAEYHPARTEERIQ